MDACGRHEDYAKGMETMLMAWRPWLVFFIRTETRFVAKIRQAEFFYFGTCKGLMETRPKAWRPCQRYDDHAKSMFTLLKA